MTMDYSRWDGPSRFVVSLVSFPRGTYPGACLVQPAVLPRNVEKARDFGCSYAALWGRLVTCGPIVNRSFFGEPETRLTQAPTYRHSGGYNHEIG
jgi:hypothetical protein